MMVGRFRRAAAMTVPGMFLSQPGRETLASYHWARMTVSMESAMMSREGSEAFMPSVPMEMPSLTPMVWKIRPTMPAALTPALTSLASVVQVHVAGVALPPHAGDADLGLLHILVGKADAVEHGLGADLGAHLGELAAVLVQLAIFGHDGHRLCSLLFGRWECKLQMIAALMTVLYTVVGILREPTNAQNGISRCPYARRKRIYPRVPDAAGPIRLKACSESQLIPPTAMS